MRRVERRIDLTAFFPLIATSRGRSSVQNPSTMISASVRTSFMPGACSPDTAISP
jgi:hypothetical protein